MSPVSEEKQYELIYLDLNQVTTATKSSLFDLSKWIVTLNVLIVGAAFVEQITVPPLIIAGPILVCLVGCLMNAGFQTELREHRRTLARVRARIGEPMSDIYAGHVAYHLEGKAPTHRNYWQVLAIGNLGIIILSSAVSVALLALRYFDFAGWNW